MRTPSIVLVCCLLAAPAGAQLTTTYKGIQREGGKDSPISAQFSVEDGRVAMIMKGPHSARMLFDAKAQVLRIVSDDEKTYLDLDKKTGGPGDPNSMLAAMQKQLEALPKEQRAMAEQMMKSAMGAGKQAPPLKYVWSTEKQKIAGYECTRVDGMRGADKITEYCGSTSSDFKMSSMERQTMLDMQGYLRNFTIMVQTSDDTARAFQWDTSTDGYPVLTRCYRNGSLTLELQLDSVNRTPLPASLFELPSGYKKMDFSQKRSGP